MARVYITPAVVPPGGQVTVHVESYEGPQDSKNVQVGFSRVELRREVGSFSTGVIANAAEQFEVTVTLPEGVQLGPHLLTDFRLLPVQDAEGHPQPGDQVNLLVGELQLADLSVFFGDTPSRETVDQIRELHAQRLERIQARIEVGAVPASNRLRVAYLYSGLLVHAPQHCEGYSILPYGHGLAPTSIFSALNEFSAEVFAVTFSLLQQQVNEFASQQPLAAILFHNVGAASADAAMQDTRPRADEISLALAFERGQAPQPFGCIVENGNNLNMWLLHRPYRGNLLSPFGHTDQGAEVERLTAAMANSPFSRLLLELYVQAISDDDPMFMFFRFWAILELLAKRAIPEPNHHIFDAYGERISGPNGQLITTSKAEAKVYKYLFDQGVGGSYGTYQTPEGQFTLIVEGVNVAPTLEGPGLRLTYWDFIQAVYAIRNGVAHEGRFASNEDASVGTPIALARTLMTLNRDGLLREVRDTAKLAVLRELHLLSQLPG